MILGLQVVSRADVGGRELFSLPRLLARLGLQEPYFSETPGFFAVIHSAYIYVPLKLTSMV